MNRQVRVTLSPTQYDALRATGTLRHHLNAALPWSGEWNDWPKLCEQEGRYFIRLRYPAEMTEGLAVLAAAYKNGTIGGVIGRALQLAAGIEPPQARTRAARREQARAAQKRRDERRGVVDLAAPPSDVSPEFAAWLAL